MTETELEPGCYEQRYSVRVGSVNLGRFVRRPIAIEPPDGAVCFIDDGPRYGRIPRSSAAAFHKGEWRGARFKPTHWTEQEGEG